MVRHQQQIDMSAIDKSLDDIILENKQKQHKSPHKNQSNKKQSPRRNKTGKRPRQIGRRPGFNRGGGGNGAMSNFRNNGPRQPVKFNRRANRNPGALGKRGRGRTNFKAHSRAQSFAPKPLHRPTRVANGGSYMTQGQLIVSKLQTHISSDDVKGIFEKFGTVTQAFVKFDSKTGLSTGKAEVFYARGADARSAQKELDGAKIDDGEINVKLAMASRAQAQQRQRGRGKPWNNQTQPGFGMKQGGQGAQAFGNTHQRKAGRRNSHPLRRH